MSTRLALSVGETVGEVRHGLPDTFVSMSSQSFGEEQKRQKRNVPFGSRKKHENGSSRGMCLRDKKMPTDCGPTNDRTPDENETSQYR